MRKMLKATALFVVYSGIGFGGEWAVGLLAQERAVDDRRIDEEVVVDVEPMVDVVVEVEPEVIVDVQVRMGGDCRYGVAREVAIPAAAIERLAIDAGAGELRVEGRDGLEEIRATAELCASVEEWLDDMQLRATESGGELTLTTRYPDRSGWAGRDNTARIDLTVLVPRGLAVEIEDSSGEIEVSGTGDLDIEDSSGSILVRGIAGHLRIDDSSGEVEVEEVAGDVEVADGSGSITVRSVAGDLAVDDGSGSITYSDVAGSVEIPEHKRKRRRRPGR